MSALEISISRAELLRELNIAQSVVERKTTIPILANFLFEAEGGKLTITATDLNRSLRTSCVATVKTDGACTIPARRLLEYIKLLKDGEINIKLMDNHGVSVSSGRSRTKMIGMARANFPQVPEFPAESIEIDAKALREMIEKTAFAISREESRYTLNGALLVLKPESMILVSTDGHRLAFIEKLGEVAGVTQDRILIPEATVSEISSMLKDAEHLDFAQDELALYFRVGDRILTSQKMSGQFPNYDAVIPKGYTDFVILPGDVLATSLQRVAQFADPRSGTVKLQLSANQLKISAECSESGQSEEIIEVAYAGDPFTVGYNYAYLLDYLRVSPGDSRFEFRDGQSAGVWQPESGADDVKYRYIVMPVRV